MTRKSISKQPKRPRDGARGWASEKNYPAHLAPFQWAWEFLRRNHDYRATWDRVSVGRDEKAVAAGLARANGTGDKFGLRFPILLDPDIASNDSRFIPVINWPFLVRIRDELGEPLPTEDLTTAGRVAVMIDLALPIDPQLEAAAESLADRQRAFIASGGEARRVRPKHKRTVFRTYLRILDADDDGASDAEIVSVLFAGYSEGYDNALLKRLRAARAAARKLRDTDYRSILMMDKETIRRAVDWMKLRNA